MQTDMNVKQIETYRHAYIQKHKVGENARYMAQYKDRYKQNEIERN